MIDVKAKKRVVIKLGTSTLTHKTGRLNIHPADIQTTRIMGPLH